MKRNTKTLTCTFYVGGKKVDKLTPEQSQRLAQKCGEVLSLYYTQHPDEWIKLKDVDLTKPCE